MHFNRIAGCCIKYRPRAEKGGNRETSQTANTIIQGSHAGGQEEGDKSAAGEVAGFGRQFRGKVSADRLNMEQERKRC